MKNIFKLKERMSHPVTRKKHEGALDSFIDLSSSQKETHSFYTAILIICSKNFSHIWKDVPCGREYPSILIKVSQARSNKSSITKIYYLF